MVLDIAYRAAIISYVFNVQLEWINKNVTILIKKYYVDNLFMWFDLSPSPFQPRKVHCRSKVRFCLMFSIGMALDTCNLCLYLYDFMSR